MALINLDLRSYFDLQDGDTVEVFINGVSRHVSNISYDGRLYVVILPDFFEEDELPF